MKNGKTIVEWLFKKRLISSDELLIANAFALFLEWRSSSFDPADSTVVFARKFRTNVSTEQIPYEAPMLMVVGEDREDVPEVDILPKDVSNHATTLHNEELGGRVWRLHATAMELRVLLALFEKEAPHRPDMLTILAQAVTQRFGVRDLPYKAVPIVREGLKILSTSWRNRVLTEDRQNGRPEGQTAEGNNGRKRIA